MRVGEPDALGGQPIHVGGRRGALGIVASDVTVTRVVGEDEYDVGRLRRPGAHGTRDPPGARCPLTSTRSRRARSAFRSVDGSMPLSIARTGARKQKGSR